MPYKIVKSKNKYKVMKKSGSSKVFGTHDSRTSAEKQIAAIYANESVEVKESFTDFVNRILSNIR